MSVTKEKLQQCTATILLCTQSEISIIMQVIQFRKEQLAKELKNELKRGDKVIIRSNKGTEHGEIVEVRRTRASVMIDGKRYTCPLTLIEKET